uniref:alpha-amylase family glycosyl hydrolase n=1 Tax=Synechococcus sp. MU1655 TaxID=2508355 RepID=UPI002026C5BC
NHCGRGFWAFHHLLENGDRSPYRQWFHVHQWPLRPYPRRGQACGYSCWWNDPALPKFNHDHAPVKEHLLAVGKYWLERGIDGWRLDVPDEVPAQFWMDFRRMVKAVNPEAWIVGEIWGDARPWLQGEHFDGVMNYRLGWSSLCWVAGSRLRRRYHNPMYPLRPLETEALLEIWSETQGWYEPEVNRCQLNLLDSHDVPRALHSLKGDVAALSLALLMLMLQPGAPCLYYGTEVGLEGGSEPACREAMPWEEPWPHDLCTMIKALTKIRQQVEALSERGLFWQAHASDGLIGRAPGVVVVVNRSRRKALLLEAHDVPQVGWKTDGALIGTYQGGRHSLGPQSAILFKALG